MSRKSGQTRASYECRSDEVIDDIRIGKRSAVLSSEVDVDVEKLKRADTGGGQSDLREHSLQLLQLTTANNKSGSGPWTMVSMVWQLRHIHSRRAGLVSGAVSS